jgi:phenylacetate-CoA ligase
VLEEQAGLYDFRLEQTGPSALCLHLPGRRPRDVEHAIAALQRHAASQGALPLAVRLHCGHPLPRGRSGKLQRIVAQPNLSSR